MLNKKTILPLLAIITLAYSCKKTELDVDGIETTRPPITIGNFPFNTSSLTTVNVRDTILDTATYYIENLNGNITISTGYWLDSTNGNSYGNIVSTYGLLGFPNDTSKITINPNGSMVIELAGGIIIPVGTDGSVPNTILNQLTEHQLNLLEALIKMGQKKKRKKSMATQQSH